MNKPWAWIVLGAVLVFGAPRGAAAQDREVWLGRLREALRQDDPAAGFDGWLASWKGAQGPESAGLVGALASDGRGRAADPGAAPTDPAAQVLDVLGHEALDLVDEAARASLLAWAADPADEAQVARAVALDGVRERLRGRDAASVRLGPAPTHGQPVLGADGRVLGWDRDGDGIVDVVDADGDGLPDAFIGGSRVDAYGDAPATTTTWIRRTTRTTWTTSPAAGAAPGRGAPTGALGAGGARVGGALRGAPRREGGSAAAPAGAPRVQRSSGTGFLVGDGRHLLTNHHVIEGALVVEVQLGGRSHKGQVVAADEDLDLALVRLPRVAGPAIAFAPEAMRVGVPVFAFGYGKPGAEGENSTLFGTRGSIAAREGADIFFDALVNPGNSGGPLVDERGFVVGVVKAKFKSDRAAGVDAMGIGTDAATAATWLARHRVEVAREAGVASGETREAPRAKVAPSVGRVVVASAAD